MKKPRVHGGNPLPSVFSQRLFAAMERAGLDSLSLGRKMGYAITGTGGKGCSTISCWLHGRSHPNIPAFQELCRVLGVSPDYLLGWSDTLPPQAIPPAVISDLERAVRQLKSLARPCVVRLKEASSGN